jgi:hypothetical protein
MLRHGSGEHAHCPCALQTVPVGQLVAVQTHWPCAQFGVAAGHTKHCSPPVPQGASTPSAIRHWASTQHPSGHDCAVHWHIWSRQTVPGIKQSKQVSPPLPHAWKAVPGWQTPCWSQQPLPPQQPCWQVWGEQVGVPVHCPAAVQVCPGKHCPQKPPQPSGPHARPAQSITQHAPPSRLHPKADG